MTASHPAAHTFGHVWPQPLFPFQVAGVERLVTSPSVLLADEMGLGKTVQTIAALRILHARGEVRQALAVVPTGLIIQWRRQLRQWAPELRLSTVVGGSADRAAAWRAPATVFITSYDSLRSDIWIRSPDGPGSRDWDIVIADEAQRFKNAEADTARTIKRLKAGRRWALSGTPLENRLDDLISILDFVAPGRFDPKQRAVGLRKLLAELQLRRRRSEVLADLPPKFAASVHVELKPEQRITYRKAREEGLMRLDRMGRERLIAHVLELILRLKQICNFCSATGESAKLDDLKRRLEGVVAGDEKALIFSQFVDPPFGAKRLASELRDFAPLLLTGAMDAAERAETVAAFERDPRRPVLILSLRAGGVGLNLTAASYVFHFDRWWNPAVEAQAEDRTHRIGQERPVHVAAYLAADTIEERIDDILKEKRALFADVVDGVDADSLRRLDLDTLLAALHADG